MLFLVVLKSIIAVFIRYIYPKKLGTIPNIYVASVFEVVGLF